MVCSFVRKNLPRPGQCSNSLIDIPGDGVRGRAIVRDVTPGKGMGVGIVAMSQEDRARYFTFLNKLQS